MKKFWITTFVFIVLLAGCGQAETRLGWAGSSLNDQIQYQYEQFTGDEAKDLILAGDVTMNYDVVVESGSLMVSLTDPQGTAVWDKSFQESDNGEARINIDENGRYRLTIIGKDTNGRFDFHWES